MPKWYAFVPAILNLVMPYPADGPYIQLLRHACEIWRQLGTLDCAQHKLAYIQVHLAGEEPKSFYDV